MGRIKGVKTPAKFSTAKMRQAYAFCLLGLTNDELAEQLDVSVHTITYWLRTKPAFKKLIQKGRNDANSKVAIALFKRATGYDYPEEQLYLNRVKEYDEQGNIIKEYTKPEIITVKKHITPEVKAIQFWLQNKTRNQENPWVHAMNHEIRGKITTTNNVQINNNSIHLKDASLEELKVLEGIGLKLQEKGDSDEN